MLNTATPNQATGCKLKPIETNTFYHFQKSDRFPTQQKTLISGKINF
jgi:hypothetical protein